MKYIAQPIYLFMKEVNVKKKSQGRKLIIIVNLGGLRISMLST